MLTDPIADFLTRIRNGYMAGKTQVAVPHSEMKYSIAKILEKNDFLTGVALDKDERGHKTIVVSLRSDMKATPSLIRKSTPGRRVYIKAEEIQPVMSGYGVGIVSTSKGIMTTGEAKHANLGGEYLCEVY